MEMTVQLDMIVVCNGCEQELEIIYINQESDGFQKCRVYKCTNCCAGDYDE